MERILLAIGIVLIAVVFPLVAAVIVIKRRRIGWGIATLLCIPIWIGWLVAIFALLQKPGERAANVFLQEEEENASPGSPTGNQMRTTCENCGARTQLGKEYTFILAVKSASPTLHSGDTVHVSPSLSQTPYKFSESSVVFLCNKCVVLDERRKSSKVFRNVMFLLLGMLMLSIPISFWVHNLFFITPFLFVIFAGPVTLFQAQALKMKEKAPLRVYRDLCNNPEFPNPKGQVDLLRQQRLETGGEMLAMRLRRPSLKSEGVDAIFSHEEAKNMKVLNPWRVNLDKQKRDGLKYAMISGGLGLLTLVLLLTLPSKGAGVAISYLAGSLTITFLSYGVGILMSGNPGGTLMTTKHWFCPYCKQELADDDLPTPGYFSACPKCGRTFGRKGWFE
jgi:hypothetical protein